MSFQRIHWRMHGDIAKVIVEKKPQVECSIRDYRGIHIEFVRKDISGP